MKITTAVGTEQFSSTADLLGRLDEVGDLVQEATASYERSLSVAVAARLTGIATVVGGIATALLTEGVTTDCVGVAVGLVGAFAYRKGTRVAEGAAFDYYWAHGKDDALRAHLPERVEADMQQLQAAYDQCA
jgi:hypothetical protein